MKPKKRLALETDRALLFRKAQTLLAADDPSAEEIAEANKILTVDLKAIDEQLATFDALEAADRKAATIASFRAGEQAAADPMRGFRDAAEFALCVRAACAPDARRVDERLLALAEPGVDKYGAPLPGAAPSGYMSEGGSSGEGYEVPPAIREAIWSLVFDEDDLLAFVNPEPTGSNSVDFVADETTPWGATGVQAYWGVEAGQLTASKIATKGGTLKLNKLHAYVILTDELGEDAPRLANRVTKGAADAIRWKASEAVSWGDGVGKPLGWMNGPCLVTQAKESSQSAAGIIAQNVAKMFSRNLNPGRATWLANSDCLPELVTMTLGNQPIWTPPATGITGAPGGLLLGRPIRFSEHCKTMGTLGDLQFVDPTGYYGVVKTGGVKFASSIHLFFDYDLEAYRWTIRLGGQPFLSAAVTPAKSANTKSHFVALATRP